MPIRECSGLAVGASSVPGCVLLSSHPPGNILQDGVGVVGGLLGHPCGLLPLGAPRMSGVSTGHVDSASFSAGTFSTGHVDSAFTPAPGAPTWLVSVWATRPPPANPLPDYLCLPSSHVLNVTYGDTTPYHLQMHSPHASLRLYLSP